MSGQEQQPPAKRSRERKANAALQMRLSGATWEDIAQVLGYPTPRAASVAYESALEAELHEEHSQAKMRNLAGKRLERIMRACWSKAIDPDHPEQLQAASKVREILQTHARIYGLEAPTQMVISSPTQNELETWVSRVTANAAPALEESDIFADTVDAEVLEDVEDAVQTR